MGRQYQPIMIISECRYGLSAANITENEARPVSLLPIQIKSLTLFGLKNGIGTMNSTEMKQGGIVARPSPKLDPIIGRNIITDLDPGTGMRAPPH